MLTCLITWARRFRPLGGSPGLVVMGRDSHSEGCGFESRHRILDGHFFTYCKNCNVCLKKTENKQKRGRGWPIFFKKKLMYFCSEELLQKFSALMDRAFLSVSFPNKLYFLQT